MGTCAAQAPESLWGPLGEEGSAIFALEVLAAVFAMEQAAQLSRRRHANAYAFVGNKTLLATIIKAASKCDAAGAAAYAF